MEVILDTLGAEQGFEVAVEAGFRFCSETGNKVCFVGNEPQIKSYLGFPLLSNSNIRIVDASEHVAMGEFAKESLSIKKNASICVAMKQMMSGNQTAIISPGHSGATVVAARDHLGFFPGVEHACLCQMIPTQDRGHALFADVGASLNAAPEDLCRYAVMSLAAAGLLLDAKEPRVGLLNIGTEASKGNRRLIDTYRLMAELLPGFIGNIEGNQIWLHAADVVITDGITGNMVLKSAEGLVSTVFRSIAREIHLDAGSGFHHVVGHFRSSNYGGAILLGVKGICIICHGQAKVDDLLSACQLAARCLNNDLVGAVKRKLECFPVPILSGREKGDE